MSPERKLARRWVPWLRILDFGGSEMDTKSPSGRMLLTMFAAVAEFERGVMLSRQKDGIAKAKAAGKYNGRAPTARAKAQQVRAMTPVQARLK